MTLSVASHSAESFEDWVSDVVGLVTHSHYLPSPIYGTVCFCFKSSFYCRLAFPH